MHVHENEVIPTLVQGIKVVLINGVQVKSTGFLPAICQESLLVRFQGWGGWQALQRAPSALQESKPLNFLCIQHTNASILLCLSKHASYTTMRETVLMRSPHPMMVVSASVDADSLLNLVCTGAWQTGV